MHSQIFISCTGSPDSSNSRQRQYISATYRPSDVMTGELWLTRMNLQELQLQKYFFSPACSPIIPVTVVDVIPAASQRLLPSELKDYSPETCAVDGCDLPVYKPGNNPP